MGRLRFIAIALLSIAAIIALTTILLHQRVEAAYLWSKGTLEVAHGCSVFSPGIFDDEHRFEQTVSQINEVQRDGPIEMYDTPIGTIWYPANSWTLPAVVEKNESDPYRLRFMIKRNAVVLDVGANVGTETRSALEAGARLVIAIEPEPLNVECLRRNLVSEIREGRVIVVPKGVWDKNGIIPLHLDPGNAGGSSFVWGNGGDSIPVDVTTIDYLVKQLNLSSVDFIKIHAEGAEKNILLGAADTIRRYHPRIAIALEHRLSDAQVLPAETRRIWPGYHMQLTSCTKTFNLIHPGVALMTP